LRTRPRDRDKRTLNSPAESFLETKKKLRMRKIRGEKKGESKKRTGCACRSSDWCQKKKSRITQLSQVIPARRCQGGDEKKKKKGKKRARENEKKFREGEDTFDEGRSANWGDLPPLHGSTRGKKGRGGNS